MFRFLRCNTLFLRFSSIQAFRIEFPRNPSRNCHYQRNPPSPLLEYLQTSLGFSPERALTLSQRYRVRDAKNPESVITFFKSRGFSGIHIKSIINKAPFLLCYASPESSLGPKIQFFKEKRISEADFTKFMVSNPRLFTRSLEQHIKPVFDFLRRILGADDFAIELLTRSKFIINMHIVSAKMTTLRNCGVPNHHISHLFMKHPGVLMTKSNRFNEVVEMVRGMGFKPQSRLFVDAVFTIVGLSRQTWDAKFKVYASLGLSAEEIPALFRRHPICMRLSEEKIRKGFDYLTKELGWVPSYVSSFPTILFLSLEKRIIPRHRFLQFLYSKGLIKKDKTLARSSFILSEKRFLKNFVRRYESEIPDILDIYEGLIGSKLVHIGD